MGLTALKGKKSKKKTIRSKARTGLAGVPVEKGFEPLKYLENLAKENLERTKKELKF